MIKFTVTLEKMEEQKIISRYTEMFVKIEIYSNKRSVFELVVDSGEVDVVKISGLVDAVAVAKPSNNLDSERKCEFKIDRKEIERKILLDNPGTQAAAEISFILIQFFNNMIFHNVDPTWKYKLMTINTLIAKNTMEYNLLIPIEECIRYRKIISGIKQAIESTCGCKPVVRGGSTFYHADNVEIHIYTLRDRHNSISLSDYYEANIYLKNFENQADIQLLIGDDFIHASMHLNHGESILCTFDEIDANQPETSDPLIFDLMRLIIKSFEHELRAR
jgi:hypothetical protein